MTSDRLRKRVSCEQPDDAEQTDVYGLLEPYCAEFNLNVDEILAVPFTRIAAHTARPYGQLYAY